MTSFLVQSLPSINSSLLGLIGALYAAYAVYKKQESISISQKVNRIENAIENLYRENDSYSPQQTSAESLIYTEQGNINLRHRVDLVNFLLEHMEKNSGNPYGHRIFQHSSSSSEQIDDNRIAELLDDLIKSLDYSMKKFLYEKKLKNKDALPIFRSQIKKLASFSENREKHLNILLEIATRTQHELFPWKRLNYQKKFDYFNNCLNTCLKDFIPELERLDKTPEFLSLEKELNLLSRKSVYLMAWILIFGIFFPAMIPNFLDDLLVLTPRVSELVLSVRNFFPARVWKYFLLLANLAPYFWLLAWVHKKVPVENKFSTKWYRRYYEKLKLFGKKFLNYN